MWIMIDIDMHVSGAQKGKKRRSDQVIDSLFAAIIVCLVCPVREWIQSVEVLLAGLF